MEPDYDALVAKLEQVDGKDETVFALRAGGEAAKPALLRGMRHPAWRVRHGCLRVLDHTVIDEPTRVAVVNAMDDPHRKVRRVAHHVLGCEACKPEDYCGIEDVDLDELVLNTALNDPSAANRRVAMVGFMSRPRLDDRTADAMRHLLAADDDQVVRARAARALAYPSVAHLRAGEERLAQLAIKVSAVLDGGESVDDDDR